MNCDDIENKLEEYQGMRMSNADRDDFEQHVLECEACEKVVSIDRELVKLLKTLPVVEPSVDFEARVLTAVRHHHAQRKHGQFRFITGFSTAMVASLAIWVASTMIDPVGPVYKESVVEMIVHQAQPVKLMLESRSESQQVELNIVLPENAELEGYPGQQQLVWTTELKKGVNMLELPVTVNSPGDSEIIAQVSYGNQVKTVRINLKTTKNGVMNIPSNSVIYAG